MPLLTIDPIGSRFIVVTGLGRTWLVIIGPALSGDPLAGCLCSATFGTVHCPGVYVEETRQIDPHPATVRIRINAADLIEELMKAYPAVPRSTERPMPDLYDGPLTKREKDLVRKKRKDGER